MKILNLDNPMKTVRFMGEKLIVPVWVNWIAVTKECVRVGYAAEPTADKSQDMFLLNPANSRIHRIGEAELDYTAWYNTLRFVGPDRFPSQQ